MSNILEEVHVLLREKKNPWKKKQEQNVKFIYTIHLHKPSFTSSYTAFSKKKRVSIRTSVFKSNENNDSNRFSIMEKRDKK